MSAARHPSEVRGGWRIVRGKPTMGEPSVRIVDHLGGLVAEARAAGGPLREATNHAKIIVRCVNSHVDLVDALLAALPFIPHDAPGTTDVLHPVLSRSPRRHRQSERPIVSNHIPPPYTISGQGLAVCLTAQHEGGEIVVAIVSPILGDAERPTLEFIQNACNNYESLLKGCQLAAVRLSGGNAETREFNSGFLKVIQEAIETATQTKLGL